VTNTLVLGIESSCDETAAAIVDEHRSVRSSVIASQHALHLQYAGVVPELASRAHLDKLVPVVRQACSDAGVSLNDLNAIAVGHAPGLIGSLLVGVSAAKALAWSLGIPLIGVHHVLAHVHGATLNADALDLPAIGLVASGGHTHVFALGDQGDVHLLAWTIDDAIGEAFDKAGTMLRAGYPGGPALEQLATRGDASVIKFPIGRPRDGGFSFSGLKTALLYALRGQPKRIDGVTVFPRQLDDIDDTRRCDLAAAFQVAAVAGLRRGLNLAIDEATAQGAAPKTLVAGGGVISNAAVRNMLETVAVNRSLTLRLPPAGLCVDNAAMIAALGLVEWSAGRVSDLSLQAMARSPLGKVS
jgi:N6-L-threonylcarbamoyladenine synthase